MIIKTRVKNMIDLLCLTPLSAIFQHLSCNLPTPH